MIAAPPPRPDVATLLDWLEGRLSAAAAALVADQVATGDRRTQGTVEWLRGFLGAVLPLHEPPPLVRQNLRQYFARRSAPDTIADAPRELLAAKFFDSRTDLALSGVRAGAAVDDAVHLAYSTPAADVVIDVQRLSADRVRIDGQVLPAQATTAPVFEASVTGGSGTVRTVDGDEFGRFGLPDVPDTVQQLRASNGEITIVADLELRSGRR